MILLFCHAVRQVKEVMQVVQVTSHLCYSMRCQADKIYLRSRHPRKILKTVCREDWTSSEYEQSGYREPLIYNTLASWVTLRMVLIVWGFYS